MPLMYCFANWEADIYICSIVSSNCIQSLYLLYAAAAVIIIIIIIIIITYHCLLYSG